MKSASQVSHSLDLLGRGVANYPRWWIALGNLESAVLADRLESIPIRSPVYVCGLARSGSTLLLEILAAQPGTASQRYGDFPFVFTPYWWNTTLALSPLRDTSSRERSHGDGMIVGADSPEAMDEMLWMAFFPNCHDAEKSHVLDAATAHPPFERFYRNHIRKLLLARERTRYLCKGNYHVTRMEYLLALFPDARFIVPVREPAAHIGSLMRQHQRLCEAGRRDARVVRQMNAAGHFEFGLNRTPIRVGDAGRSTDIAASWRNGNEVRGWALYWDMIYGFIDRRLDANPALKRATLIVRFEDLCAVPRDMIGAVLAHSLLPDDTESAAALARTISKPDYYPSPLSSDEVQLVKTITQATAGRYGY